MFNLFKKNKKKGLEIKTTPVHYEIWLDGELRFVLPKVFEIKAEPEKQEPKKTTRKTTSAKKVEPKTAKKTTTRKTKKAEEK